MAVWSLIEDYGWNVCGNYHIIIANIGIFFYCNFEVRHLITASCWEIAIKNNASKSTCYEAEQDHRHICMHICNGPMVSR